MNTQTKIDLTTLFTEEKPEYFSLVPFLNQVQEKTTVKGTKDLIICPNCKQSHYIKKGKNKNGTQRFKCKECSKHFSLLLKAIDIELMFNTYYEVQNKDNPSMLNTILRKIHACVEDQKYRICFNQLLCEYELKGYLPKECISHAFKESNQMIDRLEWKWLQRQVDNWYFFLNYNNTDISYLTLHLNQKLVRNYNITLPSQQDPALPLIYCAKCGSSNIIKDGFNHTPRRRIRCINCNITSIVRLENIITREYFKKSFTNYLKRSYNCLLVIDNIFNDMHHQFYDTPLYDYFQTVVDRTMLITHDTKRHILRLFLHIYDEQVVLKAHFSNHFDSYPELADEKIKLVELFSDPKRFESDHPLLFNWEENAMRSYKQMIGKVK